MFQINHEHFDAFAEKAVEDFARRMADRIAHLFPQEIATLGLKNSELLPIVQQGIATAETYGVVGEMDVELYVDCLVLLGPRFDNDSRFDWAGEILQRLDIDGTSKMDLIHDHLVFATDKVL